MTNLEALVGEIAPYSATPYALEKRLLDAGVPPNGDYNGDETLRSSITTCAIRLLVAMLPLISDSTGKSSSGYDKDGLMSRIKGLCAENGVDISDFIEVSTVTVYPPLW